MFLWLKVKEMSTILLKIGYAEYFIVCKLSSALTLLCLSVDISKKLYYFAFSAVARRFCVAVLFIYFLHERFR